MNGVVLVLNTVVFEIDSSKGQSLVVILWLSCVYMFSTTFNLFGFWLRTIKVEMLIDL